MLGFSKTAISPKSLAEALSCRSIRYLQQNLDERELRFQNEAVAVGMDRTRFLFEATALELFTVLTAIKTVKPTKGFSAKQAWDLSDYTLELHAEKFQHQLPLGIECDLEEIAWEDSSYREAFLVMFDRLEEYDTQENLTAADVYIPKLFVKLCGVPDPNGVLFGIGRAIFTNGGYSYARTLRRFKISPPKLDSNEQKIDLLISGLRDKGQVIPSSLAAIPGLPCSSFAALKRSIYKNELKFYIPTGSYNSDIFNLMATSRESFRSLTSLTITFLLPLICLILAIFLRWPWIFPAPVLFFVGSKFGRRTYRRTLFRNAVESEKKFCFLFCTYKIGLAMPDYHKAYIWRGTMAELL